MVRHAFRVLTDDKIKTRLIAFSDDMDALRKVPDNVPNKEMLAQHLGKPLTKVPDPFGTHDKLRRAQQCAAARLPRSVRLRLRIHVVDRLLHVGPLRRGAPEGAASASTQVMAIMLPSLREERAQTYSPFLPISIRDTGVVLQVPVDRARRQSRHHHLRGSRDRRARDHAGHRRPLQAAMEAGLGDALGRARRRLRDGRQGSDQFGEAVRAKSAARSAACRRKDSITSSFSTRTARRSRSRRATASPSTSGCATPARRACRCSCIASRRRRSGSISTSSRVTSTSISNSSTPISGKARRSGWQIRSGTFTAARRRKADNPVTLRHAASRWSPRRTRRTPRPCGASSAATGRA